eukprot:GEMP01069340.1.p1 GENE.GEMP01069340.1~~GEMP01069340.1.p1  ORF type:complete len:120 (-),score=14.47 GEMP01069340.1:318-677(-)
MFQGQNTSENDKVMRPKTVRPCHAEKKQNTTCAHSPRQSTTKNNEDNHTRVGWAAFVNDKHLCMDAQKERSSARLDAYLRRPQKVRNLKEPNDKKYAKCAIPCLRGVVNKRKFIWSKSR